MRIFVTGASGFVGGAATKHFAARGDAVLAMSRSEKSDAAIAALGGAPVRCDLESVTAAHIEGAEAVVHCAAFVEQWGPRDAWKRFNVDGTARMLAAAQEAGVRRFIHISTESVLWNGQHLRGADETYPLAPDSPYPYAATKAQAEMLVQAASWTAGVSPAAAPQVEPVSQAEPLAAGGDAGGPSDGASFETIILRPRFIWGPGDTTLLPTIEKMAKSGQWMWVNEGRAMTSTTHVANLVHAIELALTEGRSGEAYFILDDGVRSMHEMISGIAAARGIALPERSVPGWFADALGATCAFAWGTLPLAGEPPITPFSAMILSRDSVLNDDKARAELGYRPVISVEEGLAALASAR